MSVPMSQVLGTARTFLNDDNATTFTDFVLIPKIQEAHRELQNELWLCGSPIVRSDTIGSLPATAITFATPVDMLAPTEVFESDDPATTWFPMTEQIYLFPAPPPVARSIYWSWQRETLLFNPATTNRKIYLRYRRSIPVPVVATDPIGVLSGEQYLAARAAAMAAGSVGNADAMGILSTMSKENLAKVIQVNRGAQKPLNRPN